MIIIGGGISGIYLSILLKKYLDMDVVVLEANDKPLKKLLATGNGRCNLSNKDLDKAHYDGDIKQWVNDILHDFEIVNIWEISYIHIVSQQKLYRHYF